MSERDKMLAGELYNCLDAELRAMAVAARRRVAAYCATAPGDEEELWRMLGEIFARQGPAPGHADSEGEGPGGEERPVVGAVAHCQDLSRRVQPGAQVIEGP